MRITELPLICDGLLIFAFFWVHITWQKQSVSHLLDIVLLETSLCVWEVERGQGGERWREGERTAGGGGGGRWQGQWGWLGPDLRESWLHSPSSTTTKSPDPAAKCLVQINETEFQKYFQFVVLKGSSTVYICLEGSKWNSLSIELSE